MVLGGDNTKEQEKILGQFEKNKNKIFTPKELEEICKVKTSKVRSILKKLLDEEKIEKVTRGKYKYAKPAKPPKPLSEEKLKRYLTTIEKTCEIAIHELMLTEPLVGEEDRVEIEHQMAFFARHLVKSRWELKHGFREPVDVDDTIFKKARRIHEWSKYVFEKSLPKRE